MTLNLYFHSHWNIDIANNQRKQLKRTTNFNMPWTKPRSSNLLAGLSSPEFPFIMPLVEISLLSPLFTLSLSKEPFCFSNCAQAHPALASSALWERTGSCRMVTYADLGGLPNFLTYSGRALLQRLLGTQKISISIRENKTKEPQTNQIKNPTNQTKTIPTQED